ncbi:hypothetical protein GCK32_012754, partial [Trichostrongylus colubriformis]
MKEVTQTTESEGWVQRSAEVAKPRTVETTKRVEEVVEDRRAQMMAAARPEVKTVTTTKTTEEEEARRLAASGVGGVRTVTETRTTEDEEASRRLAQSRIPQLTKRVTTTTTAEGVVQHLHDELAQPTQVSTTTRKEDEDAQWKASEGEGFWTDGAYTTSPSPPPVPRHRFLEEETYRREAIEIGKAATEPEFIRPLRKEYTVDEGGRVVLETVLMGNPRPKVRFFFNDKELRKESKFCEILISEDTYSFVIDTARLEHAGFYKITAE